MRKILLIAAMIAYFAPSRAQLTFEYTYDRANSLAVYNLDDDGYKYALYDTLFKQVILFNLNHSAWKTVSVNIPPSAMPIGLQWVSKKLFNLDNKFEFAFSYYEIISQMMVATTKIYNEDGTVLQTLDGVFSTTVFNVAGNYKLIAYDPGYKQSVYSLPGTYNNGSSAGMKPTDNIQTGIFPNPVEASARLSYSLPDNTSFGQINIYNAAGIQVKQMQVGRGFDHVIISRGDLPAGTYLYEVTAGGIRYPACKFTIL